MTSERDDLLTRARAQSWFHRIRLTDDFVTPGADDTPTKLRALDAVGLPSDLSGRRLLDIGAWDGFFTFEAERRGAEAVALDHVEKKATGFPLAQALLGSRAEWRTRNVYELDPADLGTFDVVLCLGVIYHLRHPLLVETAGLENRFLTAEGRFEPLRDRCLDADGSAILQLYPGKELRGDGSNFFVPNVAGLRALLTAAEFEMEAAQAAPEGFPTRIVAQARALDDPETAYWRDRDRATLETRHLYAPPR